MDQEEAACLGGHVRALRLGNAGADFSDLAANIAPLCVRPRPAPEDLIKIEDFRVQPFEEKLKPFRTDDKEPLLEIVLHAQPVARTPLSWKVSRPI